MNRNVESHFSRVPAADIQRSTFDRSFSLKTSFNAGQLIPILCQEVLPGDTMKVTTSKVVRLQTLLKPILDNLYIETYYFYTPNRILWKHWKEFCGENNESAWVPSTVYSIPTISAPAGGFAVGSLADFFGLPVNVDWDADFALAPSALPFRAYARICNEWFRDQNLKDPLLIPDDDAYQEGTNGDNYITDVANGGKPFIAARFHDYFSSCLPAPQRGPAVSFQIPVDGTLFGAALPVVPSSNRITPDSAFSGRTWWYEHKVGDSEPNEGLLKVADSDVSFDTAPLGNVSSLTPANLVVNVPESAGAYSFTINELRMAFATQRYLEKMAYGGSRYTELLRTLFGVTAPDASLQRPEYLGGSRTPLNVSEVTNNAQTETEYLGDLGGMSSTADQNFDFVKSFTEHGYVIGVAVVRYKHTYCQGLDRMWMRHNFLDFYQPTFANLGNQPVYKAEIFAEDFLDDKDEIFGYQEAWADYRYGKDICTSEMRPNVANSLASWHLADNYAVSPYLSSEWIDEDLTNVDRVLAVEHTNANQIFGDFYFNIEHTRPMPMYSIPGLIDHF